MARRGLGWIILAFLGVASVFLVFTVVVRYSVRESRNTECKKIDIRIERGNSAVYLQPSDVMKWLDDHGVRIKDRALYGVDAMHVEALLRLNPFVAQVEAFPTCDGSFHLEMEQRSPMLKVLNIRSVLFQIDQYGVQIPVNLNYTNRVRVASGYIPYAPEYGKSVWDIPDTLPRRMLRDLYELELFLSADSLWDAMFDQIYVTRKGEVELIPKVGDQVIELGHLSGREDLEDKMFRLKLFYKKAMGPDSWQKYSRLSLKFNNQVVATRKAGM